MNNRGWQNIPIEQREITGTDDYSAKPAVGVHCDVGGTLTFTDGKKVSHTRTMIAGAQYTMCITTITAKGGAFAGAALFE